MAPVVAVRGNVDTDAWAEKLPLTQVVDCGVATVYMLHILKNMDVNPEAAGFSIVVSGHSHEPGQVLRGGVLYVNPGGAGPRRFRLPITVARLDLRVKPWRAEFVELPG